MPSALDRLLRIRDNILTSLEEASLGSPEKQPDPVEAEVWAQSLIPVLQCLKTMGENITDQDLANLTRTLPTNVTPFHASTTPTPPSPPPPPTESDFDQMATGPGLR